MAMTLRPCVIEVSDDLLTSLSVALNDASQGYSTLFAGAAYTNFVVPAGFGAAQSTAYADTSSRSAGGGGASSGVFNLTAAQ